MVSLYVANTDNNSFDFLSKRENLTEVNFWQPGGKGFHAIEPGELFAFRLKSPRDKIGGFGVLSSSSVLPLQIVWETFGEAIRPYAEGGSHSKSNGILLRRDIHSVLDAGYATVDTDYRFVVSGKVKEVFNNGEEYRRLHGKPLRLPKLKSDWPNLEFIQWHNTERFLG